MAKEPRFVYRPDHPFGANVIDRNTGKWMDMELAREYAAVVNAAAGEPADPAEAAEAVRLAAEALVAQARRARCTLTISLESTHPPAMGDHVMVVDCRPNLASVRGAT